MASETKFITIRQNDTPQKKHAIGAYVDQRLHGQITKEISKLSLVRLKPV